MTKPDHSPFRPGVDIPSAEAKITWNFLIKEGHKYLDHTGFTTDGKIRAADLVALKKYYQAVLHYQETAFGAEGAVFNRSLREHLGLAERLAILAAPLLKIDTHLLQALMLTHDFGRMFSHRRGRNNALEFALTKELGFAKNYTRLLPPDSLWTDLSPETIRGRLKRITTEDKGIVAAVELLDTLAKWENKSQGRLRRYGDIVTATRKAQLPPDPNTMWPSELVRQQKITSAIGDQAIDTKYQYLGQWFAKRTGVDIDKFVEQAEQSLIDQPLKVDWL